MITFYSFDLFGKLLKKDTNQIDSVPPLKRGEFIELEIDGDLWLGTLNDVTYFPRNIEGEIAHLFIHDLKPKNQGSG